MKGKLLNAVTEADHSSMIRNTDLLKQLACGEQMNLEKKFGGIQKVNLFATQIHCLNYPIVTNDEALNDRIVCVPFMNRFRNTDKQLTEHLLIESLGGEDAYDYLMSQAVRGLIRFLKRGGNFSKPANVAAATQKFKGGTESIETFLDDADINEKNIGNYGYKDLATLYQAFCIDAGIVPLSKPKFHQELPHVLNVKVRKYNDSRGRRYVSSEA
jgi:phage/plasmid-associated DNA primase